jgi:magnesium transporter
MSDHEDSTFDTGYSTPVPELDDHRYQSSSVQRTRSRRGTFDSMHSTAVRHSINPDLGLVNDSLLQPHVRDFESAVVDGESGGQSPMPGRNARSRRGTVETVDLRSNSPPNSVKAFAEARRRERELSFSDPSSAKEGRRHEGYDLHLQRTISRGSGRSHRTRRYTNDNDNKSFADSSKSAEEDVCFPLHNSADKDSLQIDFEVLEDFIAEEELRAKTPPKDQPAPRVFHDLRPQPLGQTPNFTSDGDFVSAELNSSDEKVEKHHEDSSLRNFNSAQPQAENRFEYFSSLGESTIHAAEFGDLVLPGEDIRTLFTFPHDENLDGVWWLNLNNPTEEEIRAICKAFGVHPLTIEDIGTQEAREKIELFPSYYFACFRSFHVEEVDDGQQYTPFNIYVVVFREGTLSFSFSANNHATHVRKRITMLKDYVALSSDWICYALM